MGNVVGALRRFAVQKSRRFNIESRTDRFLDKNVKNAAPKPLATQKEIAKLNEGKIKTQTEFSLFKSF